MKYEDWVKKLENLKTPDIELAGHRRALRIVLLNSRRFNRMTVMDWAKILAPVTAAVLLVAAVGLLADTPGHPYLGGSQIGKFSSYEELKGFVEAKAQQVTPGWRNNFFDSATTGSVPAPAGREDGSSSASASDYSATNIQVAGVDEADVVKTDGEYIYVASGNTTTIVKAYPAEQARLVSEIELQEMVIGIFVNGDKLVVFAEETLYYPYYDVRPGAEIGMPSVVPPKTHIRVYDISNRENPQLQRKVAANGQYVSSRMVGNYTYVVMNEPVYEEDGEPNLPRLYSGGNETQIPATDIYHSDVSDYYYMYTTIMAINTQNDDEEPTYETILLGASSNLYVSLNNIYLTFPVWGRGVGDFQRSSIHRIHIDGAEIEYVVYM
jgi:uncharacterized secreted protein with C-terminal beta-propeller domain